MIKYISLCILCILFTGCTSLEKIHAYVEPRIQHIVKDVIVEDSGEIKVVLQPEYEALKRAADFYLGDKTK